MLGMEFMRRPPQSINVLLPYSADYPPVEGAKATLISRRADIITITMEVTSFPTEQRVPAGSERDLVHSY
jgi:hypothetical protein